MSSTSITRRSKLQRDKTISSFGETFTDEQQSGPVLTPGSSIPLNLITFRHSYGYNCKKPYNLYLLGQETLVYLSGNLIHFFNTRTCQITIRRSLLGTGIGCITKNSHAPYKDFLTIGENGVKDPPILIYNYPEMELQKKLIGGAKRNHTRVTYSSDGLLLASQSGEPDYILTIWKWCEGEVVLRLPSFCKDVFNLQFSAFTSELFTSAGAGHIKFWQMSHTFTGLKCHGQVGRFGKTEITDIYGLYQLEDGKVLSGSDWGNILVWENGAIKYEVFRKNHKTCHGGPITQIIWDAQEGQVLTISTDGFVRVWFWETVESCVPAAGENFVEVEPIFEIRVEGPQQEECHLMSMVKDPVNSQLWYIQDGNGGIWSCEISANGSSDDGSNKAKQLYRCHAGAIVGLVTSPCGCLFATLGADGRLHVYNYQTNELVLQKRFMSKGAAILWPSLNVAKAGNNLIVALDSGVVRVLVVQESVREVMLIQKLKSHTRTITQMCFNPTDEILVTGAEDHAIFVHGVKKGNSLQLIPIGRIVLSSLVTSISWNEMKGASTVLVGCRFGEIFELELPTTVQEYTDLTYELKDLPTRTLRFRSKKSEIRRLIRVKDYWYSKTFRKGTKEEEREDSNQGDMAEDIDWHFVPPIPNKILWLRAVSRDVLWVCVAQFDAGYIYEYHFEKEDCERVIPVPECMEVEINTIVQGDPSFLIFGISNGMIRVTRIKEDDPSDLTDYWQLGMHDNTDGVVTSIVFSYDREYLFTNGSDGNLFQYQWKGDTTEHRVQPCPEEWIPIPKIDDGDDVKMLSSEEEKRKTNADERHTVCDAEKRKVLNVLAECKERFNRIWEQNQSLAESQRLEESVFELDPRITEDLNATLERKMKMAQREMEYDVERTQIVVRKLKSYFIDCLDSFPIQVLGIRSKDGVQTLKIRKLDPKFYEAKKDLQRRLTVFKEESKERRQSMSVEFSKQMTKPSALSLSPGNEEEFRVHRIESVLREVGDSRKVSNLHTKIRRLIKKYKERKAYEQERKLEWEAINLQKPNSDINHQDDVQAILEAEQTIGDYRLKLDEEYVPKEDGSDGLLMKFQEILSVQERVYELKKKYNYDIFSMRMKKEQLLEKIKRDEKTLQKIHRELPEELRKPMVEFRDFNEDLEFPEKFIGIERVKVAVKECEEEESLLDHLAMNDTGNPSPAELELKAMRVQRKAFEQELLLNVVNEEITNFDEDLNRLSRHRLTVEMDALFLETFLLTLQKEYSIIESFHEEEMRLSALAAEKRIENGQFLSKILTQETALETSKKNMEILRNEKRVLLNTFDSNCLENKFTDFLKWIFEKAEGEVDNESSRRLQSIATSSTATTSSSLDDYSITSSNYDETFCPRGCDPDLYKLAFDLRQSRFQLNQKIAEESEVFDRVKGDLDFLTREIKDIQMEQKKREDEYVALRRRKQTQLNSIDTLIVLRLDQLQYFKDEKEFGDISKTLLFRKSTLLQLYARVGELSAETLVHKRNHRVNIVFLSRLKSDCHFMEQQLQLLRDQVKETMVQKFGMPVNLDELQEALLTKLLFEIRLNVDDVVEVEFKRRMAEQKRAIAVKQVELTRVIQEGTEKLNVLTVLHEERNNLDEILANQIKLRNKQHQSAKVDFTKDLEGLRLIVREQDKQIEFLQREIRTLSLKCKPFSSVPQLPSIGTTMKGERRKSGSRDSAGYEGSYVSVIQSDMSSGSNWTMELRADVERVIGRFLRKKFEKRLLDKQIERISSEVSDYFHAVLGTYCEQRRDELLPCIVEDVLRFLPRDAAAALVGSHGLVVNLFDRVVRLCKTKTEIVRKDIIWGIVENTSEVVSRDGEDIQDEQRTKEFYIEIWRQILITLPLEELTDNEKEFIEELRNCLSRLDIRLCPVVDYKDSIIPNIKEFVMEHSAEEISFDYFERVMSAYFDNNCKTVSQSKHEF